jgi:hypothetical protein
MESPNIPHHIFVPHNVWKLISSAQCGLLFTQKRLFINHAIIGKFTFICPQNIL